MPVCTCTCPRASRLTCTEKQHQLVARCRTLAALQSTAARCRCQLPQCRRRRKKVGINASICSAPLKSIPPLPVCSTKSPAAPPLPIQGCRLRRGVTCGGTDVPALHVVYRSYYIDGDLLLLPCTAVPVIKISPAALVQQQQAQAAISAATKTGRLKEGGCKAYQGLFWLRTGWSLSARLQNAHTSVALNVFILLTVCAKMWCSAIPNMRSKVWRMCGDKRCSAGSAA